MKTLQGFKSLTLAVFFILFISFIESDTRFVANEEGSFTDLRDGKVYKTVKIGNQWVMAENFAFKPDHGRYYAYGNDIKNVSAYGYLYDWETAKNIAPEGWHLPSKAEWVSFRKSLGGKRAVWKYSQIVFKAVICGAYSGFDVRPGGCMNCSGKFVSQGAKADFWSSTDSRFDGPWHFEVNWNKDSIPHGNADTKYGGFAGLRSYECYESGKSVRLFKD